MKEPLTIELPKNLHPVVASWIAAEKRNREEARARDWPVLEGYSQTNTGRRILCLHDALLKVGEARGFQIEIPKDKSNPVGFVIRGQHVSWRIREGYRKCKVPLTKAELKDSFYSSMGRTTKSVDVFTGHLLLFITARYSTDKRIEEKAAKLLIDRVPELMGRMEAAALYAEQRENEWQQYKEESRRQERILANREILRSGEEARFALLRQVAAERDEVRILQNTVELLRGRLAGSTYESHPRTIAWLNWAEGRVRELDVLSKSPKEIFEQLIRRGMEQELDAEDG